MASTTKKQSNRPPVGAPSRFAALVFVAAGTTGALAQEAALKPVTVSGSNVAAPVADVTGFGDVPLRELPISTTVIDRTQMDAVGARRLADLVSLDPSVTDAYNAPGYWDYLTVRGFTLDNRSNYRREGLPISAETTIPLDNKERVEILKGTSGIQAGTSAPGGLVNYVVKRPTQRDLRDVTLAWTQRGSVLAAADLGGRAGADGAMGWRLNVAQERLRPLTRNLDGERSLVAGAGEFKISRDSVLEAEFEWSRKRQASLVGYSLLGDVLPAPVDPRLNLNNQPWSQPSVFEGFTGTVRFEQALGNTWRWSVIAGSQRLRSDDRTAFPYGCGSEGKYDRYCSDGTFDLYDFRSEGERRRQDAVAFNLKGKVATGAVTHDLSVGLMRSQVRNRFNPQAFNCTDDPNGWPCINQGSVYVQTVAQPFPQQNTPSTNRDERSTELSLQDAIRWNERWTTWLGLRHTQLDRASINTSGEEATAYKQGLNTPWLAVSYRFSPAVTAYASAGQGVESVVVPNKTSSYANAGQALPALRSRQKEVGLKGQTERLGWQLAAFEIHRPVSNVDNCGTPPCVVAIDGEAVHRGVEGSAQWRSGAWTLAGGATVLDAQREGSSTADLNGKRPPNVPHFVARAQAGWKLPNVQGAELQARLSHEGRRAVLPDGSIELPAWTRLDAALHYDTRMAGTAARWTVGVDNLTDRRYWKESPYQFGHVYLYPGAPRTLRVSLTASL